MLGYCWLLGNREKNPESNFTTESKTWQFTRSESCFRLRMAAFQGDRMQEEN